MTIVSKSVLAEHATAIRALHSRIVADVAEIGRRLIEVKPVVGRGNWLPWLDREFGWSEDTAENFMRVHKFVDGLSDSETIRNLVLTLPVSSVYLLAAPSTPETAKTEIIERANAGEALPVAEVKRIVRDSKGRSQPAKKKRREKQPLPDCPLCLGEGTITVNIYGPCGGKENTEPLPSRCPCTQMKRRGNSNLYANLQDMREKMLDETEAEQPATETVPPDSCLCPLHAPPVTLDDELELLRDFTRFVIVRATVKTDPKDYAEWKALLGRVKAVLDGAP